jgi:hypothetical protein
MLKRLFILAILLAFPWQATATTYTVSGANCTTAYLNGLSLIDGDKVFIDCETFSVVDNGISLDGAAVEIYGRGQSGVGTTTTVTDNTSGSYRAFPLVGVAAGDVSLHDMVITGGSGSEYLGIVNMRLANGFVEIYNLTFQNVTPSQAVMVHSTHLGSGVIHDCTFGTDGEGLQIRGNVAGDYWDSLSYWQPGEDAGIFIEHNVFSTQDHRTINGYYGGRAVVRHNTFTNCNQIDAHGADSGDRGVGYYLLYNNSFDDDTSCGAESARMRGGSLIAFNNTQTAEQGGFGLVNYRTCWTENNGSLSYHAANAYDCEAGSDGDVPEDLDTLGNGWLCKDQVGRGPENTRKPCYEWSNSYDFTVLTGSGFDCSSPSMTDHIANKRDYFEDTDGGVARVTNSPSGNDCSGTGAYYAVWYDSNDNSTFDLNETLYQCDPITENWTAYFTPYGTIVGDEIYHPKNDSNPAQPSASGITFSGVTIGQ